MLDNYKSIPVLIGVSILFLVPVGIGGFAYTLLRNENAERQPGNTANSQPERAASTGLARETNIRPLPSAPENSGGGAGIDSNSTQGIPRGKYSNPPARIGSTGTDLPSTSRPSSYFDSSVERNRLNQDSLDSVVPDYNTPSSSNNFNGSDDNSLLTPLEDDSFLEVPQSDEEELPTLSPVAEPLQPR